jgi:hypothetical protein
MRKMLVIQRRAIGGHRRHKTGTTAHSKLAVHMPNIKLWGR